MRNNEKLLRFDESPPPPPVAPPSAAPPWTELPSDITATILQRLDALEILQSAQLACATWWKVCQDPATWRVIKVDSCYLNSEKQARYNIACRHAVDRSQGQLVDLNITYGGDDDEELLDYIANRSPHLRRLTLNFFKRGSGADVAEAVKKLPELEELHLPTMWTLVPAEIESIGISCPSLNLFSLNFSNLHQIPHNEYVVAISKFMPSLQHLELICCKFDDTRLEAILDGCHHLQSLDLESCHSVFFGRDLGKRCRDQVKHLVLPLPGWDDEHICNYDDSCYFHDEYGYRDYNDDGGDGGYDGDYGYDDFVHTARSTSYWSKLVSFFTNWSLIS